MEKSDRVNILLVDDQPAKLLSYEVILRELDENLVKTSSAKEALQFLLKNDVAVVLVDVCMPDLDGFELAAMIREHPRFQRTAIIFISAILLADTDHLRGYEMGAVDYVPVPVVPEVLRAKVRVFAELYRKTRQLEELNKELERRVAERTAELEASNVRLLESESRRSLALEAGQMGSWHWDAATRLCVWDAGQYRIFGVEPADFIPDPENIRAFIHREDMVRIQALLADMGDKQSIQTELRVIRPSGETRWCICSAAITYDAGGRVKRASGVTIDITERKQAEDRQLLLAREVDHRARNALAVVQAIVRLTRAGTPQAYVAAVEGRIRALALAHTLLSESRWQGADVGRLVSEELAPYGSSGARVQVGGPSTSIAPDRAQIIALALHELATNSAKYGVLSSEKGHLDVSWEIEHGILTLFWRENGGPPVQAPTVQGFGTKILNATIKHQIGGDVTLDWRPAGLHCTLTIPFKATDGEEPMPRISAGEGNLITLPTGNRRKILLAEDEALIGMVMRDLVSDLGYFVTGPFCSIGETISALDGQEFDAAILDLNLGGQMVYPVAEMLTQRAVPFLFVTGYGPESVEKRFRATPILQKPIARETLEHALRNLVAPRLSQEPQDDYVQTGARATSTMP